MDKEIVYAITDIHGAIDHLNEAYNRIEEHANGRLARVVFLGDAIDRGPDSAGVVSRLIKGANGDNFLPQINLKGNHEDMFMKAYNGEAGWIYNFMNNGGSETIKSYMAPGEDFSHVFYNEFPNFMQSLMPDEHKKWYEGLRYYWETDTHIFVHAGLIDGQSPLESVQSEGGRNEMIWIRYNFLYSEYDWGKHVVHGHTPTVLTPEIPQLTPTRTNLDTGAVYGGGLSIGIFMPTDKGNPSEIIFIKSFVNEMDEYMGIKNDG